MRAMIVIITALTGLVSPLSANMYYPSIQKVRDDLHTTQSSITWTVTAYVIAMAVFPLVWSNLADQIGRKPVYALSMLIFTCGSIGCALSKSLTALIASRVVQSAGSSAVQGAGAGTISDIYPREKRGTALGIYYLGPLLGPCLGPLIGGYIGEGAGWRWVFWVLTIWGGVMMLLALFVLPETHRRIVSTRYRIQQVSIPQHTTLRQNNPLLDIATVRYPVIALAMFHFAMLFGAYFTNATGQPLAYENIYGLKQGLSGVCFLASGAGCIVGSVSGGRVTDLLLRRERLAREAKAPGTPVKVPAETRLQMMWLGSVVFLCSFVTCGWLIDHRVSLGGVLVMQFLIGAGMAFTFQSLGGYVIDVFPTMSARITGVQNFWRSAWTAVIVQLFPTMLENIGWGWSYTTMFFLTLVSLSLMQIVVFRGERLRERHGPRDVV
ncbi:Dityrosine transporter 1 [Coemansia erecta]|uniref:Dityrosine transporter 1 n=1 Tax=Coemansia erecta TaxID=147472 RepID=A0A9W8CNY3_9FUNG|nr:Dityrosine transporter 1 [Coemansia erecta]